MVIHKYKIHPYDNNQLIEIPKDWIPIKLGIQNGDVVLWAAVDVNKPKEVTKINTICTGQEFIWEGTFLDTLIHPNGLVIHYFAIK